MRAWIDSDVLIGHLRGEVRAAKLLRRLDRDPEIELWTGAMQRAEVVLFLRGGEEEPTYALLSKIATEPLDAPTVDAAGQLYRRWNPSHGIDVNDAILAAMALARGGRIYTLNTKHFPMPQVVAKKAW